MMESLQFDLHLIVLHLVNLTHLSLEISDAMVHHSTVTSKENPHCSPLLLS